VSNQLSLYDDSPGVASELLSKEDESASRFWEFHKANSDVYETLVALARLAKSRGRTRIGIRMLWEAMRWDRFINTNRSADDYKLNDHLTSWYARFIMARNGDLSDIFETRERKKR
jgi:hypothetical protein